MELISERHDEQPNGETFSLSEGLQQLLRMFVCLCGWMSDRQCDVMWNEPEEKHVQSLPEMFTGVQCFILLFSPFRAGLK